MADDGVIMARGRRLRVHRASRVDATGVASPVNLACFAAAPIREATIDQDPRLLIQRKIRDGRLPRDSAATIFGAPGVGGCCDGCDTPLETTQLMIRAGRMESSLWMGLLPSAGASVEIDTPRMAMLHLASRASRDRGLWLTDLAA
jgi:hypothetical protein